MKDNTAFDIEQFISKARGQLRRGATLFSVNDLLTPLIKQFLEASLEAELVVHLGMQPQHNRRSGKGRKWIRTSLGTVEVVTPRDRNASFNPKILPKRRCILDNDLDRQIIGLYAHESNYADIRIYLTQMYKQNVSSATLSRVADKILPLVQQWRIRRLKKDYPFLWLDAFRYKISHRERMVTKTIYGVIGLNEEGYKDLLGLYVGEHHGTKFWCQILTDLKNRGVEDIFMAGTNNLTGFADAIEHIFPRTAMRFFSGGKNSNSHKDIIDSIQGCLESA